MISAYQHQIYRVLGPLINVGVCIFLLTNSLPLSAQHTSEETNPFGIGDAYWRPDKAAELNLSWEIIVFDWAKIQPNGPGDFQLEGVFEDVWLKNAEETDREIVGMIINTPAWASASGDPFDVPDGLYTPYDNPENLWAVFLNQFIPYMAERGIHTWFLWNAPDAFSADSAKAPSFKGSVEDYYRLLKIGYQTIKSQDPEAQVFIGGLIGWNDVAFTREVYLKQLVDVALSDPQAKANQYFFDGVFLDIALTGNPVENVLQTSDSAGDFVTQSRLILDEAGLNDKHIWVQLRLSPTADSIGGLPATSVQFTPEEQADFIVQGSALALSAGAERISIFKLYDAKFIPGETIPYGLIRHDNSERPAFISYKFITNNFAPLINASAGRSQNSRLVVIEQPEQTVYIMWAFGMKSVDFWVLAEFEDTIIHYNRLGEQLPNPRQGIGIDELPVYVISAPGKVPDNDNQIRVSGSPRILILEGSPRPVWAAIDGTAVQIYVPPDL